MPRPSNFFTELAGVPVHYDRFSEPDFTYGTRGKPLKFYCEDAFERKLHICFKELWKVCPLGKAEVITSAGTFVDKPGGHGLGRGIDIDGIFWADKSFVTLNYPQDRRFYLAVEAILRKHFGTVLNFEFNSAHKDHFHVDDLTEPGFFPRQRSKVLYLQMALTYISEMPVVIDGLIGTETNGALRTLLADLNLTRGSKLASDSDLHTKLDAVWPDLLAWFANQGFAIVTPAVAISPLRLLQDVYEVVERELHNDAARKPIETALTTFVNHDETADWLDRYR